MEYIISMGKDIIKKRRLIGDLAKADFRKRFVGSYFGVVWMFVQPIVTVLIYYFVFGVGLRSAARWREFPMCCGWFPESCPGFIFPRA